MTIYRFCCILVVCLWLSGCQLSGQLRDDGQAAAAEKNQLSENAAQMLECKNMLSQSYPSNAIAFDVNAIRLLSWNIKKGSEQNWLEDLEKFSGDKDLILIQEARESMGELIQKQHAGHWSFAPGYTSAIGLTGVATYSRIEPIGHCHLTAYEPWLKTPKAISITRYGLTDPTKSLVVVNIHMVNFAFGRKAFEEQLTPVINLLATHNGPLIISGDFNTWRGARQQLLEKLMTQLKLQPVTFSNDHRIRFFGHPLDHVYIGGLVVQEADTFAVKSSDHNPLTISLHGEE